MRAQVAQPSGGSVRAVGVRPSVGVRGVLLGAGAIVLLAACAPTSTEPTAVDAGPNPEPRCASAAIEQQAADALASDDERVSGLLAYPSEVEPAGQQRQQEAWDRLEGDALEVVLCMHELEAAASAP